jgi:enoyl-CoA hydratase/carnithine racemase
MMHEGIRRRFGEDWYANKEVGKFLRKELFAQGTSLSAEDVAERMGFAPRVDFEAAATRARRLIDEADALEKAK